ncbi:DUF2235 domain-containing protein [filamentous cyanobacterium CCP3]|nr:DUF2235 domain-containing protein [filamentous cyanobacterium CCP3]
MKKRLVVCCDGTWQDLFHRRNKCPTNVVKIAQSIKPFASDNIQQIVYYSEGIGVAEGFIERFFGGAFGRGIDKRIQDAYLFLCFNYTAGDEIYLFGFSRGAYTARSLAGLIYNCGLLPRQNIGESRKVYEFYRNSIKPSDPEAKRFRDCLRAEQVSVELLCCWDTVGALGIPNTFGPISKWNNRNLTFHDTQINRKIKNAFHAIAIDERRITFEPTLMWLSDRKDDEEPETKLSQVCFVGDHGCIGGGSQEYTSLSDITLKWVMDNVKSHGLGLEFFGENEIGEILYQELDPDPLISMNFKFQFKQLIKQPNSMMARLTRMKDRDFFVSNPNQKLKLKKIEPDESYFNDHVHQTVKQRWRASIEPSYRPKSFKKLENFFEGYNQDISNNTPDSF